MFLRTFFFFWLYVTDCRVNFFRVCSIVALEWRRELLRPRGFFLHVYMHLEFSLSLIMRRFQITETRNVCPHWAPLEGVSWNFYHIRHPATTIRFCKNNIRLFPHFILHIYTLHLNSYSLSSIYIFHLLFAISIGCVPLHFKILSTRPPNHGYKCLGMTCSKTLTL